MKTGVKKVGKLPIEQIDNLQAIFDDFSQVIAEDSLNHFKEGFRKNGGQTDASKSGWKVRKSKFNNKGRNILVKTGALRNSLDVLKRTDKKITLGTRRVRYAKTHNEGGRIPERRPVRRKALRWYDDSGKPVFAKKAAAFKMPKREFLGDSRELDKKNLKTIAELFGRIMDAKKMK